MITVDTKKLIPFYILDILKNETDENHVLKQIQIAEKIANIYGTERCNKKTISAGIELLEYLGYDIIRVKNKGVYLGSREFEPSQISYLIDAIFSSKIITSKHAQELAEKLSSFLSEHQRKQYKYIFKSNEIARIDKTQLFYTIDIIHEAIEKGKKIEFDYKRTSFNKIDSNSSKKYVNPYYLVNSQGKYYLVCGFNESRGLANYKVEKISNIRILDKEILPIENVNGFENGFDIAKYANENIYMFAGETVSAKLLIENEYAIAYIEEWFDNNTRIYKQGDNIYADIRASETALIYWCMQYGESIQLLEPIKTREKIKSILQEVSKKYG